MNLKKIIREEFDDLSWIEETQPINLNNANFGDILISRHGAILMYVRPSNDGYYDHEVVYIKHSSEKYGEITNLEPLSWKEPPKYGYDHRGTRTNDGYVFKNNRQPTDHDIVNVIPREEFNFEML